MNFLRRDEHCTLISLSPKHSHATYFDSGSLEKKKNYDKIKEVLDDALTGFASTEGTTFVRTKFKFGRHVFNHVTEFPCVKQPESSKKEAYYALHHMRAFLLDQQNSTLPDHLKQWAEAKAKINDSDIRQEMYRIQQQFGAIIFRDVMTSGGIFYGGNIPNNRDIEDRLEMQGDYRKFMTRQGVLPFPKPSQKA